MCHFVTFANIFVDEEPECISTELILHRLIINKGVHNTFPNMEIAMWIYLILMVSNSSDERSLSELTIIENRSRISMMQKRLVNLAIMSIKSEVLQQLDFGNILSDLAARKSRKVCGL